MYGFSPPVRSNGAFNRACALATVASESFGFALPSFKYATAPIPARRPKTNKSESEFQPRRFDQCIPPATSPAANKPGTPTAAAVSGSTCTPPIT